MTTSLAHVRSCVATVLLVIALLIAAAFVIGPRTGAYRTITVLSDSMQPRFEAGDVIVVTPAPTSSVRVGDVITYEAPVKGSPVVTHRVTEVESRGRHPVVVTRGDANAAADPWRARLTDDTIWRQRFVVPGAGVAIRWLRQDRLHQLLTVGPLATLALLALGGIWLIPRRQRAEFEAAQHAAGWWWLEELELHLPDEMEFVDDWGVDPADGMWAAA